MSRFLKVLVALLAIATIATPAMAELSLHGYYRLQGIANNETGSSVAFGGPASKEDSTSTMIDQRLRVKATDQLNDQVSWTWYGEVDSSFGNAGKDGGPGGDRVSVETKNAYLDVAIPNTMIKLRTGLQGIADRYDGLVIFDDWSAISATLALSDTVKLGLLYSKPEEGNTREWDDIDMYKASLDIKGGAVNLGADFMYLNINTGAAAAAGAGDSFVFNLDSAIFNTPGLGSTGDIYVAGVEADTKVGDVGIDGFFVYEGGSFDSNTTPNVSLDVSAFAASLRAKAKVGNVGLAGRLIYLSGDGDDDTDIEGFLPNFGGNFDLFGENFMIMLTDKNYNNGQGGRLAINQATNNQHGMTAVTAQASTAMGDYKGNLAVGYFMANETDTGVDDSYGTEICARVSRMIAEKVDVSLNGAYAVLGDFWKDDAGLAGDPDNIWATTLTVKVSF